MPGEHHAEMARMVIGGPLYYSASTVLAAIDGFALMLTGQRDYVQAAPWS